MVNLRLFWREYVPSWIKDFIRFFMFGLYVVSFFGGLIYLTPYLTWWQLGLLYVTWASFTGAVLMNLP